MTDTPPSKRRFWQLHLSTAVVVTVTAGFFVGLNVIPLRLDPLSEPSMTQIEQYGWPFRYDARYLVSGAVQRDIKAATFHDDYGKSTEYVFGFDNSRLALNLAVAASICICVIVVSEYLIRRRSKP
jgi:hypothetical protein